MSAVLVFPVSTPDGRGHLDAALARGERVVTASCDASDPVGAKAPWRRLPLVTDANFLPAFLDLVREHEITRVLTGAHMVHAALSEMLRVNGLEHVRIANRSAFESEIARWDDLFARAESWRDTIAEVGDKAPDLPFLAGVIRLAFDLFGESYDDKLAALLACLTNAPAGDIVEVGALFGRSASVLLAGRGLGGHERRLFVFDPWTGDDVVQAALPEALQNYTRNIGLERVGEAFEATFSALAPTGTMAAFKARSRAGNEWYRGARDLSAERLMQARPAISPVGQIALAHIDGNHDAERAAEDIALWAPLVAPGGWVVVDDYLWRWGDGPRRAGDGLLASWGEDVGRSFVLGGSLFVQRTSAQA